MLAQTFSVGFAISRGAAPIISRLPISHSLVTAFIAKQNASLKYASIRPAMVGPIMRPAFCMPPPKAMALGKSVFRVTSSGVYDERTGVSNACTMPSSMARVITCHTLTLAPPAHVTHASASDSATVAICVTISVLQRSKRSAQMPPKGARKNIAICPANPVMPSSSAEPVRRYTSQLTAICCTHMPISATD